MYIYNQHSEKFLHVYILFTNTTTTQLNLSNEVAVHDDGLGPFINQLFKL